MSHEDRSWNLTSDLVIGNIDMQQKSIFGTPSIIAKKDQTFRIFVGYDFFHHFLKVFW